MTRPTPSRVQVDTLLAALSRHGHAEAADLLRTAINDARSTAGGLQARTQQQAATIRGLEQRVAELEAATQATQLCTGTDDNMCGSEPPANGTWGYCWCTLPDNHPGLCYCEPCTKRNGAPGWDAAPAATQPCTGECDPTTGAYTHAVTCPQERELTGRNAAPAPAGTEETHTTTNKEN